MGKCGCGKRNNGGTRTGTTFVTDPFLGLPQLTAATNGNFDQDDFDNSWCGYIAYRARIDYDGPFFAGGDCRLFDTTAGAGAIAAAAGAAINAIEDNEEVECRKCRPCGCGCQCGCYYGCGYGHGYSHHCGHQCGCQCGCYRKCGCGCW